MMPALISKRSMLHPRPAQTTPFAAQDLYLVSGVSNLLLIIATIAIAASNLRWAWSEAPTSFVALALPAAIAFASMPFAALGLGGLAALSQTEPLRQRSLWLLGLIAGSLVVGLATIWVLAVIAGNAAH